MLDTSTEQKRQETLSSDSYKDFIKCNKEKYGRDVTGALYGESVKDLYDFTGSVCINCGGFLEEVDGLYQCKDCKAIAIYM